MQIQGMLFNEDEIKKRVENLGHEIEEDYKDKNLFVIGVLKGAIVFLSDLIRHIDIDLELDFMAVSSYGSSTKSSGIVKIIKDLDSDISGKDVLIVEDIVDTGLTLNYLKEYLKKRNAASIKIVSLLDKPDRRTAPVKVDYVGFEIEDKYVIGYGMDCAQKYRNLPYIAYLE